MEHTCEIVSCLINSLTAKPLSRRKKSFFSTARYYSVSKYIKNIAWKIFFLNFYTELKNILNKFLIEKKFLTCIAIHQVFLELLNENRRRYFKKCLFYQCKKYAVMAVKGIICVLHIYYTYIVYIHVYMWHIHSIVFRCCSCITKYIIIICYTRSMYVYVLYWHRKRVIEILYIEGTSGPWACPSSRQKEKMSRTDPLCPIAHAACPARQRRMVQFIGSLTLEPAIYHGRAHLQRRLYLVPSMYNISMCSRGEKVECFVGSYSGQSGNVDQCRRCRRGLERFWRVRWDVKKCREKKRQRLSIREKYKIITEMKATIATRAADTAETTILTTIA